MKTYFAGLVGVCLLWIAVLTAAEHRQRIATLEEQVVQTRARAVAAEAAADSAARLANECAAQVSRNNHAVDGLDSRIRVFERTYPVGTR